MSDDIEEYEDELKEILDELEDLVQQWRDDNSNKQQKIDKIRAKIRMAKSALKTFKIELRTNNKSDILSYKEAAKEYNDRILEYEEIADRMERDELLEEKANDKDNPDNMTTDEILAKGDKIQQDDIARLKGMSNKMDDMKQIGVESLVELRDQNERLDGVDNDLTEMDSDLKMVGKELQLIAKRLGTDKMIQMFLVLVVLGLVAVIIVLIMRKFKKK